MKRSYEELAIVRRREEEREKLGKDSDGWKLRRGLIGDMSVVTEG